MSNTTTPKYTLPQRLVSITFGTCESNVKFESVQASAGEEVQKTLARKEKRGRKAEKKTHIISSRT